MSRTLLFEIGCEEIPSDALYGAIEQLRTDAVAALRSARLGYEDIASYGAPRRLVLQVHGLAECQEDVSERVKGPSAKAAFDADGRPTKAAEGFAHSRGVDVSALETVESDEGAYVFAVVESRGRSAAEILPELLERLAAGLDWPKSMRWGSGETRFSRPVRWLLALHGDDVVPVRFAGLEAGRTTWGHRFLTAGPLDIASAGEYPAAAREAMFVFDHEDRARRIREGVERAASGVGGIAVVPEKTFAEVVNLVEWPTVVVGRFDEEFLEVPREVLEIAMESHQRYFPVEGPDGRLTNAFVVVHNGDPALDAGIAAGHERVIRARLADASFFYREDLHRPLESLVERLSTIVFQERLGTLGAKVGRVEGLVRSLGELAGVDPGVAAEALRAAHLCKVDLVSHVVVEFPALQGVMGRYYALAAGEETAVADAVVEHYRPRFSGDGLPASLAGQLVSVADKLDTIVGIFGIGMPPTGSADPYALRRGALGILGIIMEKRLRLPLDAAIGAALAGYEGVIEGLDPERVGGEVKAFFTARLEGVLRDRDYAFDTVDAVLAAAADDPEDAAARCGALQSARDSDPGTFDDLATAFTRVRNLAQADLGTGTDAALMGPAEKALADILDAAAAQLADLMPKAAYGEVVGVLAGLRGPVDTFFDEVLVMDDDEDLRANRLRLLNRLVTTFGSFADVARLAR